MAESQVNSREAKLDFDEHVLDGEETNIPESVTINKIFDISFRVSLPDKYQILKTKLRGFKKVVELKERCYSVVNKFFTAESGGGKPVGGSIMALDKDALLLAACGKV